MPRYRVPFLAADGVQTDDGRVFELLDWRELPLQLAAQFDTQHSWNETSDVVGQLVEISKGNDGVVNAVIDVNPVGDDGEPVHPDGPRAVASIEAGGQGISIDGIVDPAAPIEEECIAEDDEGFCIAALVRFGRVTIGGATLTPMPAYSQAIVDPTPIDGDTASVDDGGEEDEPAAAPLAAHAVLFASGRRPLTAAAIVDLATFELDPAHFTEPVGLSLDSPPINLEDDGHIWGWIAPHGVCHQGIDEACVTADQQSGDLSRFLRKTVNVGGRAVPVGLLTMGVGHADRFAAASDAEDHYDNTRAIAAVITAGVRHGQGIWFSGTRNPALSSWECAVLAAADVSGDWRADAAGSPRTLRAALVVPVPGFPMPRRALAADAGVQTLASMVASGGASTSACGCQERVEVNVLSELEVAAEQRRMLPLRVTTSHP